MYNIYYKKEVTFYCLFVDDIILNNQTDFLNNPDQLMATFCGATYTFAFVVIRYCHFMSVKMHRNARNKIVTLEIQ